MPAESVPKKVEDLVKDVKKKNPDYTTEKVWATAWSIYCKHVNNKDESCKRGPEGYLKGRGASLSPAARQRIIHRVARALEAAITTSPDALPPLGARVMRISPDPTDMDAVRQSLDTVDIHFDTGDWVPVHVFEDRPKS